MLFRGRHPVTALYTLQYKPQKEAIPFSCVSRVQIIRIRNAVSRLFLAQHNTDRTEMFWQRSKHEESDVSCPLPGAWMSEGTPQSDMSPCIVPNSRHHHRQLARTASGLTGIALHMLWLGYGLPTKWVSGLFLQSHTSRAQAFQHTDHSTSKIRWTEHNHVSSDLLTSPTMKTISSVMCSGAEVYLNYQTIRRQHCKCN
jgi:hypothetical protein